ncbi:glycosyltransferase family 4 protein [Nonlabens mediterrranea]|uniref:Glycosyltransferase family 4 protein n=1 Tax=Nonlabens mediterrranea TaxID=1419947 RepID=A0ABS0A4B8_9FLAO|nr:glycosyltransferase family 4 protein [Nonlabens mediterrranea]
MKNILYIGNKLADKGRTATTIDILGPLLQQEGFKLRYASSVQNTSARLLHMMRLTFLSRNWAHFVLIDTYSTRNFWYAITIARLCKSLKIRYIPILHGGNLPDRLLKNPKAFQAFINNAHTVMSPSDYLIDAFAKANYKQLIKIPNHIDLKKYTFKKRAEIKPRLLWVRSFADIYNPEMALEVLDVLCEKFPDAQLCMVGPDKDGTMKKCISIAAQKNLTVEFTGLLDKEDWITLSDNYDIFLNTSNFDNLPVSVIEAMALGFPVVSTDVGGIPYLIKNSENGFLTKPFQVDEMVSHITYLINNRIECEQVSENARATAENFDWNKVKLLWLQLFEG